jgi:cytochrome c
LCCAVTLAGSADAAGDAARGIDVFKTQCAECHSIKEGKNKKGPSLFGIVGRAAATLPDVKYSDAMKRSGWTWNEEQLRAYLSKPVSQSNPGGKMKYDGLRDANALDDLIAYLQTVK